MPDESRDVYVNMLFKRSDFAKQITALEALIRTGAFDVRRVTSTFIDDDFSDLLGEIEQVILPGTPGTISRGITSGGSFSRRVPIVCFDCFVAADFRQTR